MNGRWHIKPFLQHHLKGGVKMLSWLSKLSTKNNMDMNQFPCSTCGKNLQKKSMLLWSRIWKGGIFLTDRIGLPPLSCLKGEPNEKIEDRETTPHSEAVPCYYPKNEKQGSNIDIFSCFLCYPKEELLSLSQYGLSCEWWYESCQNDYYNWMREGIIPLGCCWDRRDME